MIVIEAARAKTLPAASAIGKRELSRFLAGAKEALGLAGECSVLLTGDERLRALNLQFRGLNKPTDVLSFPALPEAAQGGHGGDLAISLETASVQAADYGHTLHMEVKVLILHGLLHLAGYDHERDQGQMRRRESLLRKQFALPAGLVERGLPAALPRLGSSISAGRDEPGVRPKRARRSGKR
jgi:probable rRNA maturation factor